jgi:hypothetical protein
VLVSKRGRAGVRRGREFPSRCGLTRDDLDGYSDHHDRNQLGAFARARAKEKHGRQFSAEEIDVIGDTPR